VFRRTISHLSVLRYNIVGRHSMRHYISSLVSEYIRWEEGRGRGTRRLSRDYLRKRINYEDAFSLLGLLTMRLK